jgi:hypothetical protein
VAGRAIFRESAVEAYRRGREKDIVPRLTSWPAIICLWLLLAVLMTSVALAWWIRVPMYVGAEGVILPSGAQAQLGGTRTAAALFLSPDQPTHLRVGQPVHAQIGSSGPAVQGTVARIEPGLIGPDTARTRYGFEPVAGMVPEPWTVAIVWLRHSLPVASSSGSLLTARVQVGSQRLLALFPRLGGAAGGAS